MATMFGCCRLATASASARNLFMNALPGIRPDNSIFNATILWSGYLSRFVNDPDAAAGDFGKQFVVAKTAGNTHVGASDISDFGNDAGNIRGEQAAGLTEKAAGTEPVGRSCWQRNFTLRAKSCDRHNRSFSDL